MPRLVRVKLLKVNNNMKSLTGSQREDTLHNEKNSTNVG